MSTRPPLAREPVSRQDLLAIRAYLERSDLPASDRTMLWCAITLAYYGFLRVSEYTCQVPPRVLTRARVHVAADHVCLKLPFSKTSQLGNGGEVVIGATDDGTCPVQATRAYWNISLAALAPFLSSAMERHSPQHTSTTCFVLPYQDAR